MITHVKTADTLSSGISAYSLITAVQCLFSSKVGVKHVSLESLLQSLRPVRFLKSNEHKLLTDKQWALHQHTVR